MTDQHQKVHLALAFDQNFITPFYVLLTSIFKNNRGEDLVFHVIASGVNKEEINRIEAYVKREKATIAFYNLKQNQGYNFVIPEGSNYTEATYYRLFFPTIVPEEVTKILYMDTDIVVTGKLAELYNMDIDDFPVAAAIDFGVFGFKEVGKYFNAGVLLINVPKWKEQQISEKAFHYLQLHPEKIKYADQDALNAVLAHNWARMDNRFNLTFNDIPPFYSKKELRNFMKDKVAVHFTGVDKPWLVTCGNRLRYLYFYYLRLSPHAHKAKSFFGWQQVRKNLPKYLKIRLVELLSEFPLLFHFIFKNKRKNYRYDEKGRNYFFSSGQAAQL